MQEDMELEEYKYIYSDYKKQVKQFPALPSLLKSLQKSTKKLECINLYSAADRKQFALEIQEKQIFEEISLLWQKLQQIQQKLQNNSKQQLQGEIGIFVSELEKIKEKNIGIFDYLNREDELLSEEIDLAQYYIEDDKENEGENPKIKEEDQFDYENIRNSDPNYGEEVIEKTIYEQNQERISQLKSQIDQISTKIAKINTGKGKWFNSDHQDFIKIYNRCNGNTTKIIDEGIKILGMKNIEIIDHLQLYEKYLQLQKEKKLITEEYRQIKLYEQIEKHEEEEKNQKEKQIKQKKRKEKELEEQVRKKQLVNEYKEKKAQERNKMLEQQQKKQDEIVKKNKVPLPSSKKKEIIDRNRKYIEEKQKTFKERNSSIQKQQSKQKLGKPVSRSKISANRQQQTPIVPNQKKQTMKNIPKK